MYYPRLRSDEVLMTKIEGIDSVAIYRACHIHLLSMLMFVLYLSYCILLLLSHYSVLRVVT